MAVKPQAWNYRPCRVIPCQHSLLARTWLLAISIYQMALLTSGKMEKTLDESHKSHVMPQALSPSSTLFKTLGKIFCESYLTIKR